MTMTSATPPVYATGGSVADTGAQRNNPLAAPLLTEQSSIGIDEKLILNDEYCQRAPLDVDEVVSAPAAKLAAKTRSISQLAPYVAVVAVLGFAKNLSIEFTTGVLWDASTDGPHSGAKGYSLWVHLFSMLAWVVAAVYQFNVSGPVTKARHRRSTLLAFEKDGTATPAAAAHRVVSDKVLSPLLTGSGTGELDKSCALDNDAAERLSYERHKLVGYYVALPALFLGGFSAGVWWQNTYGAPFPSPVWFYTVGLFLCSSGQIARGIQHARKIKTDRQEEGRQAQQESKSGNDVLVAGQVRPTEPLLSNEDFINSNDNDGIISVKIDEKARVSRPVEKQLSVETRSILKPPGGGDQDALRSPMSEQRLQLHQLYMLCGTLWASDPGLHRIVFWTRILVLYFDTTRSYFYGPNCSFATAKDDPVAHMEILTLGKMPVNLCLLWVLLESCATTMSASHILDVQVDNAIGQATATGHQKLDMMKINRPALMTETSRVIAFNITVLSFWFWGNAVLQMLKPDLSPFQASSLILVIIGYFLVSFRYKAWRWVRF
ncbi:unnamed protein product [Amoebophrya sp. A120]|nr:unnamed protein product [Amoebophrya sp. A120]|eukprot:GSA120T00010240001.1